MKKVLFSILALVLALGLALPMATPAVAQAPILTNAVVQPDGSIKATGDNFEVAYCTVTPTGAPPYAIYNNGFSGSIHHNIVLGGRHGILVDSGSLVPNPNVYVKTAYNSVSGFTKTGILNGRYPPSNKPEGQSSTGFARG